MKKTIHSLVGKINQSENGKVMGGFGTLKGGTSELPSYNDGCTNTATCDGTNVHDCTNSGNCTWGTNKTGSCTNTRDCFA